VAVHTNEEYGYVNDEPEPVSELPGNLYEELVTSLESGNSESICKKGYDNVARSVFTARVPSCDWVLATAVDQTVLSANIVSLVQGFVAAVFILL